MVIYHFLQLAEIQTTLTDLETERDFYFSKLRDIELLCQENEDQPVVSGIMDVMYATQVKARVYLRDLGGCGTRF